jgi:hypothetical protein
MYPICRSLQSILRPFLNKDDIKEKLKVVNKLKELYINGKIIWF